MVLTVSDRFRARAGETNSRWPGAEYSVLTPIGLFDSCTLDRKVSERQHFGVMDQVIISRDAVTGPGDIWTDTWSGFVGARARGQKLKAKSKKALRAEMKTSNVFIIGC